MTVLISHAVGVRVMDMVRVRVKVRVRCRVRIRIGVRVRVKGLIRVALTSTRIVPHNYHSI